MSNSLTISKQLVVVEKGKKKTKKNYKVKKDANDLD